MQQSPGNALEVAKVRPHQRKDVLVLDRLWREPSCQFTGRPGREEHERGEGATPRGRNLEEDTDSPVCRHHSGRRRGVSLAGNKEA